MSFSKGVIMSFSLFAFTSAQADDLQTIAPALEKYSQSVVHGDLWKRPALSMRDRSIVTLAALIARNQPAEPPHYLNVTLDNGVKASDVLTHFAFYVGWPNVFSAMPIAKEVFEKRAR
jgi:4-carboxymuconolactone decarboxylase